MRPSRNLGLHHLTLRVSDFVAVKHFYVELLGFAVESEVVGEELWLTTGTDSLVFLRGEPAGLVASYWPERHRCFCRARGFSGLLF